MVAAYRFFENEKGGFANVLAPQIDASYQRTARQRPTSKVSRLLARTKQPTSKEIKDLLVEAGSSLVEQLTVRERAGKY